MIKTEVNQKVMQTLAKLLKGDLPVVRVGILGAKTNRTLKEWRRGAYRKVKDQPTDMPDNAAIGAKHEFGEDGMPQRSFLRIPIQENLEQYLDTSGAFKEDALKKVISEKSLEKYVGKIGEVAVTIVQDAFHSGGFGKWQPSDMRYKHVQQTLVESTQLRDSIMWDIKK